jgi:hypothetical protein
VSGAQPLGDRKNPTTPKANTITLFADHEEASQHTHETAGNYQAETGGDTDKQILDVLKEIKAKQDQVHYSWAVRQEAKLPKAKEGMKFTKEEIAEIFGTSGRVKKADIKKNT